MSGVKEQVGREMDEVDAELSAWRQRALTIVCAVSVVGILPAMLLVLSGSVFQLERLLWWVTFMLLAAFVIVALLPRMGATLRMGVVVSTLVVFALMQLTVSGLHGGGRITLVALPLIVLVLMGPRAGWLTVGLSMLLYIASAMLVHSGKIDAWLVTAAEADSVEYWALQGFRLLASLLLLMALLSLFHALQQRTLLRERDVSKRLQKEMAQRRELEARITRISENERRAFGAELHDGLCQDLTATLLHCSALENRCRADQIVRPEDLSEIRQMIEASIDLAYGVAKGLCPVDLQPESLLESLQQLCHAVSRRDGLECRLEVAEVPSIENPEVALQLYRIAGEALANAVKYAACSEILVQLAMDNNFLEMRICDDGCGIAAEPRSGLGLQIMAYRAGMVNGAFSVDAPPGRGTSITCRIPLKALQRL